LKQVRAEPLPRVEEIIAAMLADPRLVGRTTLRSDDRRWRAVLENPIGYINCLPRINAITVDVGPILAPEFAELRPDNPISCLRPAFLLYKDLRQVEMVYRVPTAVEQHAPAATLHYSNVVHCAAPSEIFAIVE
jgi:hypothetical protein